MVTVNFLALIYEYQVPSAMSWGEVAGQNHKRSTLKYLQQILKKIASFDIKEIELWEGHAPYNTDNKEKAEKIRRQILDYNLYPRVYYAGFNKEKINIVERAFSFANLLGVSTITGTVPLSNNEAILKEIDRCARLYHIHYAIENHPHPCIESPEEMSNILKNYSPFIGTNIDTGIYHYQGYNVVEAIQKLSDRIYHVHFKDAVKTSRKLKNAGSISMAPGKGEVPFREFVSILEEIGYRGLLSVEHEPLYDPEPELKNALQYCREELGL